jgi:hypothetical protein
VRNIAEVVDKLMLVIPEDEKELRYMLKRIAADRWKPPEQLWYMGGQAFHDRFGDDPPTTGWGKQAVDIWMGRNAEDETDGLGGAVVAPPQVLTGTDWKLVSAIVVLVLLGIAVYVKAHHS